MATFPAPDLERRTFQTLPAPGTPLTEPALLQLLYDLLKPLGSIAYAYVLAHDEMSGGEDSAFVVEFMHDIMEQAVLLLEAWHEHQNPDEDEEDNDEEDEPDDPETSSPPPSRPRRRKPNA